MALNTLTLAVVQGVQGRRFRSLINGLTAGTEVSVDTDATPGFSTVNGRLYHSGLPYPVNTVAIRERVPATGETKVTRIEIAAATVAELATQAAALITGGRTLVRQRTAPTDDGNGSLVWSIYAENDYGATVSALCGSPVSPTLGTLTLSGSLQIGVATSGSIIGATSGSTIVGNIPGVTVDSAARTYSGTPTGSAGTISNALVETLAGATGSPKSSAITVDAAAPTLAGLTLSGTLQIGVAASGTIIGATAGSTIAGNIPGITVNSGARTYSGTPTGSAGTISNGLVETLAGAVGSPKSSAVTVAAASAELIPFDAPIIVIGPSIQNVVNIRAPRMSMYGALQGRGYPCPGTNQSTGGAGLTVEGATENGNAANYYKNRIAWVLGQLPDPAVKRALVIIDAGPNDLGATGVTDLKLATERQYLIDAFTAAGHWVGVPAISDATANMSGAALTQKTNYNASIPALHNPAGRVIAMMTRRSVGFDPTTMAYDGLHPMAVGADLIGVADAADLLPYFETTTFLYPTNVAPASQLAASDILTFSTNVTAGDTITFVGSAGPVVVTWVASGATGMQVNRGGTNTVSASNLNTFINANSVALGGITSTVLTSTLTVLGRSGATTVSGSGFPTVAPAFYHALTGTGGTAGTGTTGTVADGWSAFCNTTGAAGGGSVGVTCTVSKTTDADGFPAQQMDITGTATANGFWSLQTVARFLNQAGQYVDTWIKCSHGPTDGGTMNGLFSLGFQNGVLGSFMNKTRETNAAQFTQPRTMVMRTIPVMGMVNNATSQTVEVAGAIVSGQTYNLRIVISRAGLRRCENVAYAAPFNLSKQFPSGNNPLNPRPALSGTITSVGTWTIQNPTVSGGALVHNSFSVVREDAVVKASIVPGGAAMTTAGAAGDIGHTFHVEDDIANNGYGALLINDGPTYAVVA